ncbi:hypothetical protein BDZ89DRAFT_1063973 [Hymenopellis radicata]|nr:hypothetical protein BDZ89DRAFT_1063973 [Hymenopellis radicata]
MPEKVLETPYPVIDTDPHFSRVMRYMRTEDYTAWAVVTGGFPAAWRLWEALDPSSRITPTQFRAGMRVGGLIGFCGGFLLAYQNSSMRFWGWRENKREEEMDLKELTQRAKEGKPLYGESSHQPWVQNAAHQNSAFAQLKFAAIPMLNFVNHPYHGTDPAKYGVGVKKEEE